MDIYLAYWDNGLEYDDWRYKLIGVFTNKELANNALKDYLDWRLKQESLDRLFYKKQYTYLIKSKLDKVYFRPNKAIYIKKENK